MLQSSTKRNSREWVILNINIHIKIRIIAHYPPKKVREASGDDIGDNVRHIMTNIHSEDTSTWSSRMGTMLVGRKQCFD